MTQYLLEELKIHFYNLQLFAFFDQGSIEQFGTDHVSKLILADGHAHKFIVDILPGFVKTSLVELLIKPKNQSYRNQDPADER